MIDIENLPAVLDTVEAAELLNITRDHLWALARQGIAPVQPLRLGRSLRWPTRPLLELLGLGPHATNGAAHNSGAAVIWTATGGINTDADVPA